MTSNTTLTSSILKQSGVTTDTPYIGCRRDVLLMLKVVDIVLESVVQGRKQTIITRIFNRDDKVLLFRFSMLYRT